MTEPKVEIVIDADAMTAELNAALAAALPKIRDELVKAIAKILADWRSAHHPQG